MAKLISIVLLLSVLAFACAYAADPCLLLPNVGASFVGKPNQVLSCFQSVPFNASQAKLTMQGLTILADLYSFTDISLNSGAPYNLAVDLRAGFRDISNKVNRLGYPNDYAFHSDLMNLMNPLYDAHTVYRAPAGYRSFLVRPFQIEVTLTSDNKMAYYLREGPLGPKSAEIWSTLFGVDITPFINRVVTQINGQSPTDYFNFVANNFIGTYKDQGVRFNAALRGRWSQMLLAQFPLGNPNVDFVTSFTFSDGQTTTLSNAILIADGIAGVTDLIQKNAYKPSLTATKNAVKKQLIEGIDIHQEHTKMFEEMLIKAGIDVTAPKRDSFRIRSAAERGIISARDQRAAIEQAKAAGINDLHSLQGYDVASTSFSKSVDPSFLTIHSFTPTFDTVFMKYDDGINPRRVILRLTSFAPADVAGTIRVFQDLIRDAQTNGETHLIVDVAANGGGIICLSDLLLALLVPDWGDLSPDPQPGPDGPTVPYGIYDLRRTATVDKIRSIPAMDMELTTFTNYLDMNTDKVYRNASFFNPIPRTRGGATSNYTQQAYFPSECLGWPDSSVLPGFEPIPYYFKDIVVLTDGTCGSACALFSSQLQSYKYARVVSYGGPINRDVPLSTASFAGGNVLEYMNVARLAQQANTPWVVPLFSSSAQARFNFNEYYEFNDLNTPREFLKRPADIHLNYWATMYNDKLATPLGIANAATLYAAIVAVTP